MKNFNIFEVLNISHLEIKHSDVLAYLFNNKESHNLKDTFLKEFIYEVEAATNIDLNLTLDDRYTIKREYAIPNGFVDLLLMSYKHRTIIVIENKIQSKERDNQLKKYIYFQILYFQLTQEVVLHLKNRQNEKLCLLNCL